MLGPLATAVESGTTTFFGDHELGTNAEAKPPQPSPDVVRRSRNNGLRSLSTFDTFYAIKRTLDFLYAESA